MDFIFGESIFHFLDRFLSIFGMNDQLGNHRIVKAFDLGIFVDASIDPCFHILRFYIKRHFTGRWQEIIGRIFRINPTFNGVTGLC